MAAVLGWLAAALTLSSGCGCGHIDAYKFLLSTTGSLSPLSGVLAMAVIPKEACRVWFAAGERAGRRRPLVPTPEVVYLFDPRHKDQPIELEGRN